MIKHFVIFMSPGTFVSNTTTHEIESWDVEKACEMAKGIQESHGILPYGFSFFTQELAEGAFAAVTAEKSPGIYYLGGTIRTAEEVLAGTDLKEDTLRWNVKFNNIPAVIENTNSWKITLPLHKEDVLLDWKGTK